MRSEILNGTCKKCGKPCHERRAFCKKCKPKEVWKSVGLIAGTLLLPSFISALCRSYGVLLGGIPTMLMYIPACLAFNAVSKKFKPLSASEKETAPVGKTNGMKDESLENHNSIRKK